MFPVHKIGCNKIVTLEETTLLNGYEMHRIELSVNGCGGAPILNCDGTILHDRGNHFPRYDVCIEFVTEKRRKNSANTMITNGLISPGLPVLMASYMQKKSVKERRQHVRFELDRQENSQVK
jgi:hypothetical protein